MRKLLFVLLLPSLLHAFAEGYIMLDSVDVNFTGNLEINNTSQACRPNTPGDFIALVKQSPSTTIRLDTSSGAVIFATGGLAPGVHIKSGSLNCTMERTGSVSFTWVNALGTLHATEPTENLFYVELFRNLTFAGASLIVDTTLLKVRAIYSAAYSRPYLEYAIGNYATTIVDTLLISSWVTSFNVKYTGRLWALPPACPRNYPPNYYINWYDTHTGQNRYAKYTLDCPYGYGYAVRSTYWQIDPLKETGLPVTLIDNSPYGALGDGWFAEGQLGILFNAAEYDTTEACREQNEDLQVVVYCAADGFGGAAGGSDVSQGPPINRGGWGSSDGGEIPNYGNTIREEGDVAPDNGGNGGGVPGNPDAPKLDQLIPNVIDTTQGGTINPPTDNNVSELLTIMLRAIQEGFGNVLGSLSNILNAVRNGFSSLINLVRDLFNWLTGGFGAMEDIPLNDLQFPIDTMDFDKLRIDTIPPDTNFNLDTSFIDEWKRLFDTTDFSLDKIDSLLPEKIDDSTFAENVKNKIKEAVEEIVDKTKEALEPLTDLFAGGGGSGACECFDFTFQGKLPTGGNFFAEAYTPLVLKICNSLGIIRTIILLIVFVGEIGTIMHFLRS